jgi:hypothetical protein
MAFRLLLIFTLSALSGPTLAGPLEEGEAAYDHKNYTAALGLLRPLADQGDTEAQTYLGLMYDHGNGVPQNYAEALSWFRKAAEQGNGHGEANLGVMYVAGHGVARDYDEALKWLRKSADLARRIGGRFLRGSVRDHAGSMKARPFVCKPIACSSA